MYEDSAKKLSDITELKKNLISSFENHALIEWSRTLSIIWNDPSFALEQKLDILGELTVKDSEYFMEQLYPFRSRDVRDINLGSITLSLFKNSPYQVLIEMEEYILKNYCFLEGEDIKTVFYGTVGDKKTVTLGRIYVTNYRLIVSGSQTVQSAQSKTTLRPSIASVLVRSGITRYRKAIRKAITEAFRKDLTEWNIGEWGHYFPIYNAKNVKRGKSSISYAIDVETEKKRINLKIKIFPRILKGQSKKEFQEQKMESLNQIEDLLRHYQ